MENKTIKIRGTESYGKEVMEESLAEGMVTLAEDIAYFYSDFIEEIGDISELEIGEDDVRIIIFNEEQRKKFIDFEESFNKPIETHEISHFIVTIADSNILEKTGNLSITLGITFMDIDKVNEVAKNNEGFKEFVEGLCTSEYVNDMLDNDGAFLPNLCLLPSISFNKDLENLELSISQDYEPYTNIKESR